MPGGYTAIDLSQLPAPAIVEELDYETIRSAMLADLVARFDGRAPRYTSYPTAVQFTPEVGEAVYTTGGGTRGRGRRQVPDLQGRKARQPPCAKGRLPESGHRGGRIPVRDDPPP